MADPVALWQVEIDAEKGLSALDAALGTVQGDLGAVDQVAKSTGVSISASMDAAAASAARMNQEWDKLRAKHGLPAAAPSSPVSSGAPASASPFGPASSEVLRRLQQEMAATEKTAEGVGMAITLALGSATGAHLEEELAKIELDFEAGRASAEEALNAIGAAETESANRFRLEESKKKEAIKATELAMQQQAAHARTTGLVIAGAYAAGTAAVMGFIHAGLQGTAEANIMAASFMLMNREIASIFTPAIHAAIGVVQNITQALRSMSGETQETIRHVVGFAAVFGGIVTIVPGVVAGIKAINAAFQGMAAGSLLLNPLFLIGAAVAAMVVGSEQGRTAIAGIAQAFGNLLDAVGKVAAAVLPVFDAIGGAVGTVLMALIPVINILATIVEYVGPVAALSGLFYFIAVSAIPLIVTGFMTAFSWISASTIAMFSFATATGVATAAQLALNAAMTANPIGFVLTAVAVLAGAVLGLASLFGKKDTKKKDSVTEAGGGREDIEGTIQRIQSGVLKNDTAQATRERMARYLESIDRRLGSRVGRDIGIVST